MKQYATYAIGAALVDTEIQVNDAELTAMSVEKGVMTLVEESRQAELLDLSLIHISEPTRPY